MSRHIAETVSARLRPDSRVLVLGLTFKEDVPDLRNSKVADLIGHLTQLGHDVAVHDPLADPDEAQHEYGVMLSPRLDALSGFDAVVAAVPHRTYRDLDDPSLGRLLQAGRSDERRVGKECVSTCRSRWSPLL